MAERIPSFREFWPFYVGEHSHPTNRKLHFVGTTLFLATMLAALVTLRWWLFVLMPVSGYSFAWIGHFLVEKNRPATFQYPVWSLMADFVAPKPPAVNVPAIQPPPWLSGPGWRIVDSDR